MKRRDFVRLLGGGSLALATLPLAGCSDRLPAAALAPWAGPQADEPLREWALAYALLSPSAHNMQPWRVDLREADAISLHVDRERLLPATDPWFRQIMVSQGCFIEAAMIALRQRGLHARLELFPEGEFPPREVDDRPVARLSWRALDTAAPDPLFAGLLARCTAKEAYDTTRPVTPATLAWLGGGPPTEGVQPGGTVAAGRVAALRQICLDAADVEINTPAPMLESLRLMRVGPDEILRHRDGLCLNDPVVRAAAALGLLDRSRMPAPGSAAFAAMRRRYADCCLSAMGFAWLATAPGRRGEVQAGRAWLRLQLRATAIGLQLQPMSQALQEFPEMGGPYRTLHQYLLGGEASQRVLQMVGRLGYCATPGHTPRRALRAIIRA